MKRTGLLLSFFVCVFAMQAQSLRDLYINIPDSLSPLLSKVNRQDFGDFIDSRMKAVVRNKLDASSEMKQLTDDYLLLRPTMVSQVEMLLLPVNDSTKIICVVNTYEGPVADSNVRFYTTDWHPLGVSTFIELPHEEDFYIDSDSARLLAKRTDAYLKKAMLDAHTRTIKFVYTTPEFVSREFAEKLKPYLLRDACVYTWREGRFVRKRD